jgi:hypothetical protein
MVPAVPRSGLTLLIAAAAFLLLAGFAFAGVYGKGFPTRAKYVKEAEKVCKGTTAKMNKQTNAANAALKKGDNKKGGALITASGKTFGKGVGRLGKIIKPKADRKVLKKWIVSLKGDAKSLVNLGMIIQSKGVGGPAHKALAAEAAHAKKTNGIVGGFGFQYCLVNA